MHQKYLRLVAHDLEVLKLLTDAAGSEARDVSDWKCTLLFYMACIYVKALAKIRRKELQDHFQVKSWLNSTPDLTPIARSYRKLEERSRDARYEGRLFTRTELTQSLRWFSEVREAVVRALESEGASDVPRVDPSPWLFRHD